MEYIADKLGSASPEVRARALESLDFKWKYGLVGAAELLQDRRVLRGLLSLLSLGDGMQTSAVALLLLRKLAAAEPRLATALLELGALQQLHAFTGRSAAAAAAAGGGAAGDGTPPAQQPRVFITPGVWPDELLPSVEALVDALLAPAPEAGAAAAAGARARARGDAGPTHPAMARPQPGAAGTRPGSAAWSSAQSPRPGAAAGLRGSVASAAGLRASVASTGSPGGWRGAGAGAAAAAGFWAAGQPAPAAAAGADVRSSLVGSWGGGPGGAGTAAGDGAAPFDERLLRARARVDWRQQEAQRGDAGVGGDAPPLPCPGPGDAPPPAGHLTLPLVSLSAADDQALFELNVRLQYSDDERLLLPALLELGGAAALDMPAEALLARQSVLTNVLALLASKRASRDVQRAASGVLLQLLVGLKHSLALAAHPELARSEFGDARASEAAAAAAGMLPGGDGGDAAAGALAAWRPPGVARPGSSGAGSLLAAARLAPGGGAAAAALAAARAAMFDPSCPITYPQLPLPDAGPEAAWAGLACGDDEAQRVDVTAAVISICLQAAELLSQPERHFELLPLLEAALPLLVAPLAELEEGGASNGDGGGQPAAEAALQAVWRGLLAALGRALASAAAVAAGDRAAALAAALSGSPGAAAAAAGGLVAGDAASVVLAAAAGLEDAAPAASTVVAGGAGAAAGPCCWDTQSLNLLLLSLRLINAVPAAWCSSAVVPPSLADAAAAAACDEAVALLMPELRPAAERLLQRLRPAALEALAAAARVHGASAAGEAAAGLLAQLEAQPLETAPRWLARVDAALPCLGVGPRSDARLLQCVLHGLVALAGAASPAQLERLQADSLLVRLLGHEQAQVPQALLALLGGAAAAGGRQAEPVRALLLLPAVTEALVVQGLGSPALRPGASALLLSLLRGDGPPAAAALTPWRAWVASALSGGAGAGDAPGLAQALDAHCAAALTARAAEGLDEFGGEAFWSGPAVPLLQDLFNAEPAARRAAGRALLDLLLGGDGPEGPDEELLEHAGAAQHSVAQHAAQHAALGVRRPPARGPPPTRAARAAADDPFRGLLEAPAAAARGGRQAHLPPDPLTDASPALAANFTPQDVANLLRVLGNDGLAQELRRAAAEELLALSARPELLRAMDGPGALEDVWRLAVPTWHDGAPSPGRGARVGAGPPSGSIFDMGLPVAALQLLAGLLARSPGALAWVLRDTHRLLVPLLPLALHSLHSVRRAVARVLAVVLFSAAAQRWAGWDAAAGAAAAAAAAGGERGSEQLEAEQAAGERRALLPPGADGLLLPEPFLARFKFPFRVLPVPLAPPPAAPGDGGGDGGAAAPPGAAQRAQQQAARVQQLVEQQQLLQAGGGSAAGARRLLGDVLPPALAHVSARVRSATANQLFNVDAAAVAGRLLAALARAGSHAEAERALRSLEQLGSSAAGLAAIAAAPGGEAESDGDGEGAADAPAAAPAAWLAACERLLGAAPVTADDQRLWLALLGLVERLLAAAPLSEVQLTHLQVLLQRSVSAWLAQPAAARAVPRPPLALAAGSGGWDALRRPSSAAATAAVAELLGGGASSGVAAVAASSPEGLLALRVSRQALRVLLALVRAVRAQRTQRPCAGLGALQPAALVRLLATRLLGAADDADYACRLLAGLLLGELGGALQDAAALRAALPAAAGAAGAGAGDEREEDAAAALLEAVEPLITRVLMPVAGKQLPGFRGKALVRAALEALSGLVEGRLVRPAAWAPAWAAIGGTFWLSRLARDREAAVRRLALGLVPHLLAPAAGATQALVTHHWPDCANRLARVACDACEAHGVRAAALRGLAAAMVLPAPAGQAEEQSADGAAPARKVHCFGLGPLLQLEQLWAELVPGCLLAWVQLPPVLVAAAAALAATAMAAQPDGVGRQLLLQPGLAAAAAQLAAAAGAEPPGGAAGLAARQAGAYVQLLQRLGLAAEPHACARLVAPCAGLAAGRCLHADAGANATALAATVRLQHAACRAGAAAGAAQLLALAIAPASAGGGLLLLPAAVQDVLRGAAGVLARAISAIGGSLQLALVHVAAAGVLAAPLASLPAEARRQQLLELLQTASGPPRQQHGSPAGERRGALVLASGGSGACAPGGVLVGLAACLACGPAASGGLKLAAAQLVGLLCSDAAVAAAALGVADAPAAPQRPEEEPEAEDDEGELWGPPAPAAPAPEACCGGAPVGAALCRELAAALPDGLFTPAPPAAAGEGGAPPSVAPPEGLAVVFALQNLLAFSRGAKAAAVEVGLHRLLSQAARAMAAAVAPPPAAPRDGSAPPSGSGPPSAAQPGRVRARWFSGAVATTAAAKAPGTGAAGVAFGRSGGPAAPPAPRGAPAQGIAAAAAGPRRAAGPRAAGSLRSEHAKRRREQQAAQQAPHGGEAAPEAAAESAAEPAPSSCEPAPEPAPAPEAEPVAEPAPEAEPAAEPARPATATSGAAKAASAAARAANQRKLQSCVMLLRHMAFGCHDTQAALVGDGLVDLLLRLWPLGLGHTPLLLELLRVLDNLLPTCYEARLAAATLPPAQQPCGAPLLAWVLALVLAPQPPAPGADGGGGGAAAAAASAAAASAGAAGVPEVVAGACVALQHYASTRDGAAQLVKAGSPFLGDAQLALRGCLLSARREAEPPAQRAAQAERAAGLLGALAAVAGRPEGQRAMLRASVAPALLELLVEAVQLPGAPGAAAAGLLALRNLAFSAELLSPAVASAGLLPLLLAAAEALQPPRAPEAPGDGAAAGAAGGAGGWAPLYGKPLTSGSPAGSACGQGAALVPAASGNVCAAAYAVSALWALMWQGERVKAALRKLPGAAARLAAVRAHAAALLEERRDAGGGGADAGRAADQAGGAGAALPGAGKLPSRLSGKRGAADGAPAVWVRPASLAPGAAAGGTSWWLEQLACSAATALDLLEGV
ncbi:hypothetical protein HT031_004996 [Scenedesmus sp. PABB004]|nr:hypothetical protein HT031_004996 [Scenedesmus sp. PABB004]